MIFGFPVSAFFKIEHLGDYVPEKHSLLLLDEVGMIWHSRDFKRLNRSFVISSSCNGIIRLWSIWLSRPLTWIKKSRDLTDGMFLQTNFMRVFPFGS